MSTNFYKKKENLYILLCSMVARVSHVNNQAKDDGIAHQCGIAVADKGQTDSFGWYQAGNHCAINECFERDEYSKSGNSEL